VLQRLLTDHNLIVYQLKISKAKQKTLYTSIIYTKTIYCWRESHMLNTQNSNLLNQPSKKFRYRYIGPYKTIEKISSQAYKLDLTLNMKVNHVFHIGLLK